MSKYYRLRNIDLTVLGGFPVNVEYNVYPSEPDIGIFHHQIEINRITLRNGRRCDFIIRKMTSSDDQQLIDDIEDNLE